MAAAGPLGDRIAERWPGEQRRIGTPAPGLSGDWPTELAAAQGPLTDLAAAVRDGQRGLTVMPRCAGALATLPVVAAQHPGVCVVWFDAHADLHLPGTTTSGYLGGMALSGPLGWWDSGFGAGVGRAVLVGTRDIDPAEHRLIAEHDVEVVAHGADLADLHDAMRVLSRLDVVGLEIAELQRRPGRSLPDLDPLLAALRPVVDVVVG